MSLTETVIKQPTDALTPVDPFLQLLRNIRAAQRKPG